MMDKETTAAKVATVQQVRSAVGALSKAERGFKMAVEGCARFEEVFREWRGLPSAWSLKECEKAREMAGRVAKLAGAVMRAMGGEELEAEEEASPRPKAKKGGAK